MVDFDRPPQARKWYKNAGIIPMIPVLLLTVLNIAVRALESGKRGDDFGFVWIMALPSALLIIWTVVTVGTAVRVRRMRRAGAAKGGIWARLGLTAYDQLYDWGARPVIEYMKVTTLYMCSEENGFAFYTGLRKQRGPVFVLAYSEIVSVREAIVDPVCARGPGVVFETETGSLEVSYGHSLNGYFKVRNLAEVRRLTSVINTAVAEGKQRATLVNEGDAELIG